jgi:hypothetical protein
MIGNGSVSYQLTRRCAKIAHTKNSTRPIAAATPISGTTMPAIKPRAPANFSAPSGSSHEAGTSTLAALATAVSARRKSKAAAHMFIAAATTAAARRSASTGCRAASMWRSSSKRSGLQNRARSRAADRHIS